MTQEVLDAREGAPGRADVAVSARKSTGLAQAAGRPRDPVFS